MNHHLLPRLSATVALTALLALQGNTQDTITSGITIGSTGGPTFPGVYVPPQRVKTIGPLEKTDKDIKNLCASNGQVYFVADDGTAGNRIWVSNGTEAGTLPLVSYGNVPPFDPVVPFGTRSLFRTAETAGGAAIYTTSGTTASALNNVAYAPTFGASALLNGKLYFPGGRDKLMAWTLPASGLVAPSPLDPNAVPAVLRTMPAPAAGTAPTFGPLVALNGSLIFSYASAAQGAELFISNGTTGTSGTVLLKDQIPGATGSRPAGLVAFNGKVYYAASSGVAGNVELCSTNGTAAGTGLFVEINRSTTVGSAPAELTVVGNKLYFTANDGTGRRLWVTDGTTAGTKKLTTGLAMDPKVANLVALNGRLYFTVDDGTGMRKIWSHGTGAPVLEPWSPAFHGMDRMLVCNNKLVYIIRLNSGSPDGGLGHLCAVEPSVATPAPVNIDVTTPRKNFELFPGTPELAVVGNRLYFKAQLDGNGTSLWKVDL